MTVTQAAMRPCMEALFAGGHTCHGSIDQGMTTNER